MSEYTHRAAPRTPQPRQARFWRAVRFFRPTTLFRGRASPHSGVAAEGGVGYGDDDIQCAICLDTSGGAARDVQPLACGHQYCRGCIAQHAQHRAKENHKAACPQCQKPLAHEELRRVLGEDAFRALLAGHGKGPPAAPQDENAQLQFLQWAHRHGLRCCPSCRITIFKDGGCNSMRCRCGNVFCWSEAPLVPAPGHRCHQVHPYPGYPGWGTTCDEASWIAKTKLFFRRAGVILMGTPMALVAIAGGAIALAAIAIIWASYIVVAYLYMKLRDPTV